MPGSHKQPLSKQQTTSHRELAGTSRPRK